MVPLKRVLALVVALALASVSCGSTNANVDVAEAPENQTEESETASTEEDSESADVETNDDTSFEDYESPLQDFLGVDYSDFDSEDSQAEFAEQEREAQEKIAVCMRELGWEYTAVSEQSFISGPGFESPDGLEWGTEEWVTKYGFGITTQAFPQSQVGPDLIGFDDTEFDNFDDAMADDPNFIYAESLSQPEQQAYYEDLYGDSPQFDDTLTEEEQQALFEDFEPTGCQSVAYEDLFGGGELQGFYEEFGSQIEDIYDRVASDPRIVELQTELTDCLADEGHVFEPTADVQQQVYELFEGQVEPMFNELNSGFEDPFDGLDPESMTEEEINAILDAMPAFGPELSDANKAQLAELQTEELDLATDMWACQPNFMNSPPGGAVYFDVLAEYEQAFLDENASSLGDFAGAGADS